MAKSVLVDINGQPFTLPDLSGMQTESDSKVALLHRHYSQNPSSGLTPSKAARILKEAEQGDLIAQCELGEDMEEKDAHIQSELAKRKLAWMGVDWNIMPPTNPSVQEKRDAEMIEELLRDATWLDDAIFDSGDAILKSFANLELRWDYADKTHFVCDVEWRDPAWFQTHPEKRNEIRVRNGSYEGEALWPFGWISHTGKAKSGYLSRRGLVRVLVWPFLFKNYSVRDLAEFLEIYGLPLRLGKYPEGASDREKMTLLRAVMSIGHNAGGIIPKGMEIDFQAAADGASDPFMAMVSWCEKSQSKAILGGTLTSQADGKTSTNALGNVHNEVRQEIRDADLRALGNTLTRDLVYPLYALNGKSYRSPRRIPRLVFDTFEPEDLAELGKGLAPLVKMGVQIPVSYVREKTRIPEPVGDEPVLTLATRQPPEASPVQGKEQAALAALKALAAPEPQDQLQAALEQLGNGQLNEQMRPILAPIMELAAQGPAALKAGLGELWPEMDDSALTEQLARVLFVSELWGMVGGQP